MGNKKILIVDDDPDVLHSMHVRLKANNYDTFFAADAISCMAEAQEERARLSHPRPRPAGRRRFPGDGKV